MLDRTLQAVGLQAPPPPTPPSLPAAMDGAGAVAARVQNLPSKVTLRLHAGDVLNVDASGVSVSVVARIYKLRGKEAFERASYDMFAAPDASKSSDFARDVIDVRDVVLTPGQRYEVIESVGSDAPYFAVVALFRAPAQSRWRFVFDTKAAAATGITMGVHGCALSVAAGTPLDTAPELLRVAGVRCGKA
jgi:type VI secretion system protein VasD